MTTLRNTLVLAYRDCILFEAIPAAQRLESTFPVRVATPDGRTIRDESGYTVLRHEHRHHLRVEYLGDRHGGIRHPLLADFWPHGAVAQSLGIFNDEVGMAMRTLFIIDPDGVVRHSEMHTRTLPDPAEALAKLASLKS